MHESKRYLRPISVHLLMGSLLALSACEKNPFEQVDPPGRANVAAGQAQGIAGEPLSFGCIARDPSRLDLTYAFDWGDTDGPINPSEPTGGWTEPLADGRMGEQEHVFEKPGSYAVRCVARNTGDVVGDWSEPFTVTISPRPRFTLTTSVEGEGTVRSSPEGIDCGTRCEVVFEAGTPLTLTATPAPGWSLVGWTGKCEGAEPRISLVLSAEASCTARFARDPLSYTFRMTLEGEGRVTSTPAGLSCTGDCTETLTGGTVSLKAEAAEGWKFERWGGACTGTAETTQVTLDVPLECTARFVPIVRFEQSWQRTGTSGPRSTVWSPDGTRIAAALGDVGTVALWDAGSGALLRMLPAHPSDVRAVAWSPDGTQLATGGGDGFIRFWNSSTGELIRKVDGPGTGVRSLAWSPDGTRLASVDALRWRIQNLSTDKFARGEESRLDRIQWSPDGTRLAFENWGGPENQSTWKGVYFRDPDGESLGLVQGRGFTWGPLGDQFALDTHYGKLQLYQVRDGTWLRQLSSTQSSYETNQVAAWSPDGQSIAAGDETRLLVVDPNTDKVLGGPVQMPRGTTELAFHPSRASLAVTEPGGISVLATPGLTVERTLERYQFRPLMAAWSPDARTLATVSEDGRIWLWNAQGQWLRTLSGSAKVTAMGWDSSSTWIASGYEDGTLNYWRAEDGSVSARTWNLGEPVSRIAWSPMNVALAAGSTQGRVMVWNPTSTEPGISFVAHQSSTIRALAWRPIADGKMFLLTGGENREASLWNSVTGEHVWSSPLEKEAVGAVAWRPDGKVMVTAGGNGAGEWPVRLWDFTTREPLGTLAGRASPLTWLAWSGDGELLAGTRQDGSVEMWNMRSRTRIASFAGVHPGGARSVSWDINFGEYLTSCGADSRIVTWRVMR
ncbi:hypothetical protein JRI60_27050 [Archangium violaceum]|uniref:WD40 domain-containing protein n=1 Tax=Archangium violaceum TaxID=83451 RepID=UPI00194F650F|nr:hypothetical protein [Archangium violaceum]QRN92871.1 hypothetical protein JRI60_27050 [Archangium violaceum]